MSSNIIFLNYCMFIFGFTNRLVIKYYFCTDQISRQTITPGIYGIYTFFQEQFMRGQVIYYWQLSQSIWNKRTEVFQKDISTILIYTTHWGNNHAAVWWYLNLITMSHVQHIELMHYTLTILMPSWDVINNVFDREAIKIVGKIKFGNKLPSGKEFLFFHQL